MDNWTTCFKRSLQSSLYSAPRYVSKVMLPAPWLLVRQFGTAVFSVTTKCRFARVLRAACVPKVSSGRGKENKITIVRNGAVGILGAQVGYNTGYGRASFPPASPQRCLDKAHP